MRLLLAGAAFLLAGCGAVILSVPAVLHARCVGQCVADWECERVIDGMTQMECISQCSEMCIAVREDWDGVRRLP